MRDITISKMDCNKKANLKVFYEMSLKEAELAKRNIDIHARKAKDIFHTVLTTLENSYGTQNCLNDYDSALTDLSLLSDILRKFNLKFELTPIFANATSRNENLDIKPNLETVQMERFTYPHPELGKYKSNYEADCVITYVKDSGDLLFYIYEIKTPDYENCHTILQNYFNESPQAFVRVPNEGEVFGLHLENYMFRAVRENGPVSPNSFNAYLIDIGEIVNITNKMEMYVLPIALQKAPSQAILCKLMSVHFDSDIDLKNYLSQNLYVKQTFTVNNRENGLLHVDLRGNTNPFRDSNNQNKALREKVQDPLNKLITNPFRKYFCLKTQYDNVSENGRSSVSKRVTVEEHHAIVNEDTDTFSQNPQNCDLNNDVASCHSNSRPSSTQNINLRDFLECSSNYSDDSIESGNGRNFRSSKLYKQEPTGSKLTEAERRILYEEPLNTTNAMKAVMGYEPKDDKRICQFYNPRTDSCFKGAHCRFEHVQKIKDGWTRDEAETIIDIPYKIVYPANGMTIIIKPTHIVNIDHFFAQIVQENRYNPTLKELILKMNSPEESHKFKKVQSIPVRFELVLAKFKDGMWYRAKVLNVLDDDTMKVFYVDYGNSDIVSVDCIRKWQSKYDYLPFQAVPCRLAGVKERRKKSLEGVEYLRKIVLNKAVKAVVINNVEQLHVKLSDTNGIDIAEDLMKMGYVDLQPFIDQIDKDQLLPA